MQRFLALGWNWDPYILASLMLACVLYVRGLWRLESGVRARLFSGLRYSSFAAGIVILFFVLISPFDALDDQLFAAHMAQHMVLMMVAPPLLIFGRPGFASFWAFPVTARIVIAHFWTRSHLRRIFHGIMSPLSVWLLCSVALWFWHIPGPYGWAVENEFVHAVEHICFFVSSLMFWSLVVEPIGKRRLGYGAAIVFVLTFGIQNGLLGALLTFAAHPFYAAYAHTTAVWGLTPLEDQQVGGLSMWIPSGFIHVTTLGILFVDWLRAAERTEMASAHSRKIQSQDRVLVSSSADLEMQCTQSSQYLNSARNTAEPLL